MTAALAISQRIPSLDEALFDYCLRLGDNTLVLGQRLCEWMSNAPTVELDIALANQALDLLGQSRMLFDYAGRIEGKGRSEDDLAFLRDVLDFRNVLLVEQPNGDFGQTVARQLIFGTYARLLYESLSRSKDEELSGIARKAVKEVAYHARHNGEWLVRLGDGTEESHTRAQQGLDALWPYVHELFMADETDLAVAEAGIGVDPSTLREPWLAEIAPIVERATLTMPETGWMPAGGKQGRHSEHLGHLLADMQFLQRAYPGAEW